MESKNYADFLEYCKENRIDYVLLRYPHLLPREIHDLDMLVGNIEQYKKIASYLQSEKFICLEKEPFRSFWAKKIGKGLVVLDIYNRISWLGWTLLHKNRALHRKKNLKNGIVVCSEEDELLIYLAQALFKNNGLNEYKTAVVRELLKKKLDWNYIFTQMKNNGWLKPGKEIIGQVRRSKAESIHRTFTQFSSTIITTAWKKDITKRILVLFSRISKQITAKLTFPRKSTTICLLGPDGSGKSTLAKSLKQEYETFFKKFELKVKIVYFGWKPFLPMTKLLSSFFKKKEYNIVQDMNEKKKRKIILQPLLQPFLFSYLFIEYLARYLWIIGTQQNKKRIIIIDRYFYDIYAHYQGAQKSTWFHFLLRLFPKPDYLFLLDVPVERLWQRKQEMAKEKLREHLQKYHRLAEIFSLYKIDTTKNIETCKEDIITKTWRKIARRVR